MEKMEIEKIKFIKEVPHLVVAQKNSSGGRFKNTGGRDTKKKNHHHEQVQIYPEDNFKLGALLSLTTRTAVFLGVVEGSS